MNRALTIIWLRFTMWLHGLRHATGVMDTVAGGLKALLAGLVAIGLGIAFGGLTYLVVTSDTDEALQIGLHVACYSLAFFAVVLPLLFGGGRANLDLARLAFFPISRASLYRISLASSFASGNHIFWYPSLLGLTLSAVLLPDINRLLGLVLILVTMVLLVVWSNLLLLLLGLVMRRRATKELLGLAAFLILIIASFAPAMLEATAGEEALHNLFDLNWIPAPVRTGAAALPPSLAAGGLLALHQGNTMTVVLKLGWLLLWTAGGLWLGNRVFNRALLDPGGSVGTRGKQTVASGQRSRLDLSMVLPARVAAVAGKELIYLLRSSTGKLNLLIMPAFTVLVAVVLAAKLDQPVLGIDPGQVVFFGLLLYATVFPHNFLANSFAWEGGGIKSYFLCPVTSRQILLGKNIGVWLFSLVLLVECVITWLMVAGSPGLTAIVSGGLVFTTGILVYTIAGNFVSTMFPVKRDPAGMNSSPSQVAVVVMFVGVLVNATIISAVLLAAGLLGSGQLQALLLAVLGAVVATVYWLLLGPAARLLEVRKESLIETLRVTGS
jgi:hypothetical protein